MTREARLAAALGGSAAPARDRAFALRVIEAMEQKRYPGETLRAMLRAGGIAAAAGSLAYPLLAWAGTNAEAFQNGIWGAAALIGLVGLARLMSARATVLLRR